jgi:hypothetical protein
MRFRSTTPEPRYVPLLGRIVQPGEEFEAPSGVENSFVAASWCERADGKKVKSQEAPPPESGGES